jgi:hypothetical protein
MRFVITWSAFIVFVSLAVGQAPPKPSWSSQPSRTELTASVAAAPSPALRYELLPRFRDRTPGNAAIGYLRAAVLRPSWPRDPKDAQALNERTLRWEEASIEQLPVAEVREFLKAHREMFNEVDAAARMSHCDWYQGRRIGLADLEAMFSTVQANREITRYLSYRSRVELAENRFDDAIRTLQTMYQFGKHAGEGRTVIEMLVGFTMASISISRTEELIARPGSPNLYWALTTLPRPFIDPRPALEGEMEFVTSIIPGLKELEKGPVPEELAVRALETAIREMGRAADMPEPTGLEKLAAQIGWAGMLTLQGPAAKKDLLALGWPQEQVEAMSAAQAMILRAVFRHRERWDDRVKLFFVPYSAAVPELNRLAKQAKADRGDALTAVFALAYPPVEKVHHAHARLERRLTQLQAVEAVRLHAALHNGVLPANLSDITAVPVPNDPHTGQPFVYRVVGDTFTLSAPPPIGEPKQGIFDHEYVVTVRK